MKRCLQIRLPKGSEPNRNCRYAGMSLVQRLSHSFISLICILKKCFVAFPWHCRQIWIQFLERGLF